MKRPLQHHALESLHIDGYIHGEEQILVPFLEGCSQNLKSISGVKLAYLIFLSFQNARISHLLSNIGVVWTHLDWRYLPRTGLTDSNLAKVISIGPNWTNIELYNSQIGSLAAAAIEDNCERLEVFDIMGDGTLGLSGSHLQTVLSKAPGMRFLQAHWLLGTEKISSVDILSSEWATTSLEYVDFKINVPRVAADQEEADDDDSRDLRASSLDIQRRVLRRFGQQTHLRKMVIGGKVRFPATGDFHHQLQCLEMTLESGLDELEGLKKLEHLDIHHMDHRVGVPELEWMVANFPKLKHLRGMRNSLRPPKEGVEEWLSSYQPTWS